MKSWAAFLLASACLGCGHRDRSKGANRRPPTASLVVHTDGAPGIDLTSARWLPTEAASDAVMSNGNLALTIDLSSRATSLQVMADGGCAISIDLSEVRPGANIHRTVSPWLDYGGPYPQVGFATPFVIDVKPGCPQANHGVIHWKQLAGPTLDDVRVERQGFYFSARTVERRDVLPDPLPWGVVPVSPRTRGEVVLEATWEDGVRQETHEVRVAAVSRSRGLPTVPLGTRIMLGGRGWQVRESPPNAHAELREADGTTTFEPDVAGLFRLRDGVGRELLLRPARYDQTPLDCGRSSCHQGIAAAAARSPMADALRRVSTTNGRAAFACAVPCHSTGELGVLDGGFTAVAQDLRFATTEGSPLPHAWPPPLARLAGVGCLACHGPGAIPEPSARWSILRTDVCAYCHDAPPRYGHVKAWRASAMADSDRDSRTRSEPACARCHTSSGFLASQSTPSRTDRDAPVAIGITCATCHAVHDEHRSSVSEKAAPALLRSIRLPEVIAGFAASNASIGKSAICLDCHTPASKGAPAASAAAIWAGRGGLDPITGRSLEGPAPHASNEGGCLTCHRGGPTDVALGAGHAFRAQRGACNRCHGDKPDDPTLRERALADYAKLEARMASRAVLGAGPPHANDRVPVDTRTPLGRAAFDVLLVLEDPAADVHNPTYARTLLAVAERAMR